MWAELLMAVGLPIIKSIFGDDKKDKKDKKGSLVAPRRPESLYKESDVGSFSQFQGMFGRNSTRGDSPGAVNQTPSLKSVNPSRREAEYWRALYSDAARKSKVQ